MIYVLAINQCSLINAVCCLYTYLHLPWSINCRHSLKGPASSQAKYSTNMHLSNYYNIAELIDLTGISEAPPPQQKKKNLCRRKVRIFTCIYLARWIKVLVFWIHITEAILTIQENFQFLAHVLEKLGCTVKFMFTVLSHSGFKFCLIYVCRVSYQ